MSPIEEGNNGLQNILDSENKITSLIPTQLIYKTTEKETIKENTTWGDEIGPKDNEMIRLYF